MPRRREARSAATYETDGGGEHQREHEEAEFLGERDHAEQPADHPHQLEARLETRERAASHGIGTVALQQAVEPETPRRRTDADRKGGRR